MTPPNLKQYDPKEDDPAFRIYKAHKDNGNLSLAMVPELFPSKDAAIEGAKGIFSEQRASAAWSPYTRAIIFEEVKVAVLEMDADGNFVESSAEPR